MWFSLLFTISLLTLALNYFNYQTFNQLTIDNKNFQYKLFYGSIKSFYIVYRILLFQSLPTYPSNQFMKLSLRILLILIFMHALFIGTAYISGLSAILTLPEYEKPIRTRQDLLDSKMEWGANDNAWIYSISDSNNVCIDLSKNLILCGL